jgi:signal peptidase I
VVCFSPADGTRLVKRVVALPGDTVELRDDVLWLNGQPLSYAARPDVSPAALPEAERARALILQESFGQRSHVVMLQPGVPSRRTIGPLRVPADTCFVLGDNRANSLDSRFFGFVPRREIIGQVRGVLVSADLDRWLRPRFDRWFTGLN